MAGWARMAGSSPWREYSGPGALALLISAVVWGLLFVTVLLSPSNHGLLLGKKHHHKKESITVPFDKHLKKGSEDLPYKDLAKRVKEFEPEQIHLALGGPQEIYVSWMTHDPKIVVNVTEADLPDVHKVASKVQYGTDKEALDQEEDGVTDTYVQAYPGCSYVSGVAHHVLLRNLTPSTTYHYRVGDPQHGWSERLKFRTPQARGPGAFPQRVGVIGDLGQTHNSSSTLQHLAQSDPPVIILTGDYTYSDDYLPDGSHNRNGEKPREEHCQLEEGDYDASYQPRWDTWGRLTQPLFSEVPMMGVEGNHEAEVDAEGHAYSAWITRYKYPTEQSGSPDWLFYSFDLAGVHWVMLSSYRAWDEGSEQLAWLRRDLAAFDRAVTPWLVVVMHAPWYSTLIAHYKELECFRLAFEPVLYEAGVDIVLTGHVHSYERMHPVYNYTLDECGATHITIGDGGNIERLYVDWVDRPPENCKQVKVGECRTEQDGHFCPQEQPPWSAFRNPSFGHGVLEFESPTRATWTWHRNQDGTAEVADRVTIERNEKCGVRAGQPGAGAGNRRLRQ